MKHRDEDLLITDDPHWYRDAIIYEIPIRAFMDSNGDGIGDIRGLIEKLDYVQDLGATAIWILPFYPSPLRDGGYDIADYRKVNPDFGTLSDFKRLLKEAHARGIRVITELVINHTSVDHPWFQRARRAKPGSKYRDFYVWSDDPTRYADARIIFQDFESSNWAWDPVAKQYYWHRFYSHQPDLNFENPAVHDAVLKTLDFWMSMGVDGMRLDAIPYLYEREGTNCENLPETHAFLKTLRAHIDERHRNKMLLAEANQWPEDAAAYFGEGDECHMNFHFPLMPRMFMSVELENSFPIIDILQQTPQIHQGCQWATFLRNHDELTLEMVTDEDRDYMYRVYADDPRARVNLGIRRRLAPLLKERRKIELMSALLFSLPGTPVLYYGDEIGMGDNIYLGDRDAVRTPMQWSSDRNGGFSRANPQKLYLPVIIDPEYHYESVNVEAQQSNSASLLWWTKRLIATRKRFRVFGRGSLEFLHPDNSRVLAYIRALEDEKVLVVANLSRFAQHVELELDEHEGLVPVELFGGERFPAIGRSPYFLTLAPHSFFWFSLDRPSEGADSVAPSSRPSLEVRGEWHALLKGRPKGRLEELLPGYVQARRWFRSKSKKITSASLGSTLSLPKTDAVLATVGVDYVRERPETYVLPLGFVKGAEARELEEEHPHAIIADLTVKARGEGANVQGLLVDATYVESFANALFSLTAAKKTLGKPSRMQLVSHRYGKRPRIEGADLAPWVGTAEQSNTSIIYGESFILKLIRLVEPGTHPEVEIPRFLSKRFSHVAPVYASLGLATKGSEEAVIGVLQAFVENHGDAWSMTLDAAGRFFDRVLANPALAAPEVKTGLLERARREPPGELSELLGPFLGLVRLLGQRTAEMHLAFAAPTESEAFASEPFSLLGQRSLYQSARTALHQSFATLERRIDTLPEDAQAMARQVLSLRARADARLRNVAKKKIDAVRIRCHGDYHLGQVLHAGSDFVIIDFEGEPARPMGERRFKRSPFRDVAGMLRSFHYAIRSAFQQGHLRPEDLPRLSEWAEVWSAWVGSTFLGAYLGAAMNAPFVPTEPSATEALIDFYLLDKCAYELAYELDNRPDWVEIPLAGLLDLLEES